jgi:hypothetical protein
MLFRKPLPLTTVELQQSGSRLLHMAPKKILDVSPCGMKEEGRFVDFCRSPRSCIRRAS